eukprot:TRINITY_DN103434_c0_g1_i1.p1 TRINITY_DN103434_c0_g1~~TRINITY_DN103434_c0_g1_i1.p1  ORF type:complete len:440 (-),score=73.65 TRINITY_DN103434_c0_g1_i1:174-1493(-)
MASKGAASSSNLSSIADDDNGRSRARTMSQGGLADEVAKGKEGPAPGVLFEDALHSREGRKRLERTCLGVVFCVAIAGLATVLAWRSYDMNTISAADEAFETFVRDFDRSYATEGERQMRLAIFKVNYAKIAEVNRRQLSYRLGVTGFADLTPQEFQASFLGSATSIPAAHKLWDGLPHLGTDVATGALPLAGAITLPDNETTPDSIDWVELGAVSPPKNQGQCGACWAFSSTGALEGAWKIASGELVSLSEQQLVDCSSSNYACHGGSMDPAFTYASAAKVCTEASYAYEAARGRCRQSSCVPGIPAGAVHGYRDVALDDETALLKAAAKQPISVAIEADQSAFQLYVGGVLNGDCGSNLGHGVLLVGYGSENGVPYWKVKNSWGDKWGEGGYIRIPRAIAGDGKCGINKMASYPVVRKATESSSTTPKSGDVASIEV